MTALLEARGISVSFGGVRAVVDVDLELDRGQLVGLIGPNGAGKTTFIDAITGFVPCRGSVKLDGRELTGLRAHERAQLGLTRTWQSIELFEALTVRENLTVSSHRPSAWQAIKEVLTRPVRHTRAVDEAIELLGLERVADEMPDSLSQGMRKLVGVARAVVARAPVICLDEPAAGLDTAESTELGARLRQVVDAGTSMLLVDHDMGLVLSICDQVVVLEFGRTIASGPAEQVRSDPRVVEAYLGSAAAQAGIAVAGEHA